MIRWLPIAFLALLSCHPYRPPADGWFRYPIIGYNWYYNSHGKRVCRLTQPMDSLTEKPMPLWILLCDGSKPLLLQSAQEGFDAVDAARALGDGAL